MIYEATPKITILALMVLHVIKYHLIYIKQKLI